MSLRLAVILFSASVASFGLAALVPTAAASPCGTLDLGVCAGGSCPVNAPFSYCDGYCTINAGYCDYEGFCYINLGYCSPYSNCLVNFGSC